MDWWDSKGNMGSNIDWIRFSYTASTCNAMLYAWPNQRSCVFFKGPVFSQKGGVLNVWIWQEIRVTKFLRSVFRRPRSRRRPSKCLFTFLLSFSILLIIRSKSISFSSVECLLSVINKVLMADSEKEERMVAADTLWVPQPQPLFFLPGWYMPCPPSWRAATKQRIGLSGNRT